MTTPRSLRPALLLSGTGCLALAGCLTSAPAPAPTEVRPPLEASQPVLYARDGTVVATEETEQAAPAGATEAGASPQPMHGRTSAGPATVSAQDTGSGGVADARPGLPNHDSLPGESGRMYILELYQNVIEERDALSREVASLSASLQAARAQLVRADQEIAELQARATAAEAEQQRLQQETVELAGRLTTAQIRRLQAEKLLLEHKIARQKELQAQTAAETEAAPVAAESGTAPEKP